MAVFFLLSTVAQAEYSGPEFKMPMDKNNGNILCKGNPGGSATHQDFSYYSLDLMPRTGVTNEPILAAAAGTIEHVVSSYCPNVYPDPAPGDPDWDSSAAAGCYIRINHGNGYVSLYMHLVQGSIPGLSVGDHVVQGQFLGNMGNSGYSSEKHLHFGVWHGTAGFFADPYLTNVKVEGIRMVDYVKNQSYPSKNYDPDGYFTYPDEGFMCFGPVKYDTNWTASCSGESQVFPEGYKIWSLFEINDITTDFNFKVETWDMESDPASKKWEWSPDDWTEVNGTWTRAYFTPWFHDADPGDWEFRIFVDLEDDNNDNWIHVDTKPFTVSSKNFYYDMYQYNGPYWGSAYSYKAYNCTGPIVGGSQTNWEYSCGGYTYDPFTYLSSGSLIRSDYTVGDDIFGLVKVRNITADFRFIAYVYRNNVYQGNVVAGWNYVNGGTWDKAFFWPWEMPNQGGDWKFEVYLDELNGPETYLDTLNFIVWPTSTHPFFYQRNGTSCAGPVTGGQETNWWYTCENESSKFTAGETVHALAHVQNIYFNHRFKVEAYKNGAIQWSWTTDWNQVEPYTWGTSFFMPTLSNSTAGAWQFKVFIELADGGNNGFRQFDTINFDVL